MAIHPTALVAPDANLAPDVEIGAYTVIGAGVTVCADSPNFLGSCDRKRRMTTGSFTAPP